jgi:phosphoribosyl 1,2-cyclic phosphate phosphodiesterase
LDNPAAARDCSDLLISGSEHTLIDAAPELRRQLAREHVLDVDRVLLTHEHFDHIGGLPAFEYYVHLKTKTPLPVYAGPKTIAAVRQQFGFMLDALDLREIHVGDKLEFDGVTYTPLAATHSEGAFGYLIETGNATNGNATNGGVGTRTAYFPDTGTLKPQTDAALRERQIDTLIIDATFNGANWMPTSHHTIDDAIVLSQSLGARRTFLTHLSMSYDTPITLVELNDKLATINGAQQGTNVSAAHDGLTINI